MIRDCKKMTKFFKKSEKELKWYLFDANGKTLGRLSSEIAKILRGKHKSTFTPNADCGDGVIIVNAKDVKVTGSKEAQIVYRHHSGYMGGLKEIPYRVMMERHPERILEHAIRGMMPKTKLGRAMFKKLRIFAGEKHKMDAQKPIVVSI